MPKPMLLLIAIAVVLATRSAFGQFADPTDSDKNSPARHSKVIEALQGKWKSVKSAYKYARHHDGLTVCFEGDKALEIEEVGGKEQSEEIKFKVDESKTPMWIDFGKRKGIFRIEGDTLIVCVGSEKIRPTEFNLVSVPAASPPSPYPDLNVRGWPSFDSSWDDSDSKDLWVFKKKTP